MATNFYLSAATDKNGENPIRVSISVKGTRLVSTSGFSIKPTLWDSEKQCVKPKAVNFKRKTAKDINAHLKHIDSFFALYESRIDHKPTTQELGDELAKAKGSKRKRTARITIEEEKKITLLNCFDDFIRIESRANQWTDGTLAHWYSFRHHLKNMGDIDFDFFDESGMLGFMNYLREGNDDLGKKELDEKTAKKLYGNLKTFLKWCVNHGYCKPEQVGSYSPKFKIVEKPIVFLTKEELIRLLNYSVPANGAKVLLHDSSGKEYEKIVSDASALEKTRDFFCFCAFTSLRYSDAAKLKKSDIVGNTIIVTTKKTHDRLSIDLNSNARAILDKYKDIPNPFNLALPVISNQKMNDYIKDLGELCEFNEQITKVSYRGGRRVEETFSKWQLLGTHAGRRTFISTAISFGIPPEVVMKWSGHSDYKSMKPYIDIAERTKSNAMKLFDESFNKE